MICRGYTIRFVLHRRSDTPRLHLQMRVTPKGCSPVSFATGVSLLSSEWDAPLGRAKGRSAAAAEANTLIAHWSQLIAGLFEHYESLSIVPDRDQLRRDFARVSAADASAVEYVPQPKSSPALLATLTQFVLEHERDHSWSQGTIDEMHIYRRLVSYFRPSTLLANVDAAWMEAFHRWLVSDRGQQGVSVHNNLTRMRWFLRWARQKGLYQGEADREYRPKIKGSGLRTRAIVFLSREELRHVEEAVFEKPHFDVARDVFLFGCYTGLRFSDIFKLTQADVHDDYISFTTQKTSHALTVPLNAKAKAILARYAGCQPNRRQRTMGIEHPALPTPDRKTMCKHIHAMFRLIGIDAPTRHVYYIGNVRHDEVVPKYELTSTHTARHTFIVTAISLGIPIPVIMEWTGHSDYNAMRPYIAIANETSQEAMQKFNTL